MKEIAAVFIAILIAAASPARIITVDDDGPADFTTIQPATIDANDGDTIEIQPGTYTGPGNRDIDFLGKPITVTSTDPNDPNTVAATIISGDAFVFQSAEDANSILDGLTITGGSPGITITNSSPIIRNCSITNNSPAIHCEGSSGLTITNCLFADNWTDYVGGAILFDETTATLTNCVFHGNSTTEPMGASGGAIRAYDSNLTFADCVFEGNHSPTIGGAMNASSCTLALTNCLFTGCSSPAGAAIKVGPYSSMNSDVTITTCQFIGNQNTYYDGGPESGHGGTLVVGGGNLTLTNCFFAGNHAAQGSAALFVSSANVTVGNCTFADNHGPEGNTLFVEDGRYTGPISTSDIHLENSIIWDGPNSIGDTGEAILLVTFSDVPGIVPGYGNIDADPCFVDPGYWVDSRDPNIIVEPNHSYAAWVNGDYHLKSQAGRCDPSEGLWTIDEVTSPCIDAGDPNNPLGLEPFPNGGRINMGVYGGTTEARKSYFGKPTRPTTIAGDINGDCAVN